MSKQGHADLLSAIEELSRRYPDWRFGQLIANVADWADQEIWDIDDEHLLHAAQSHLDQLKLPGTSPLLPNQQQEPPRGVRRN